MPTFAPPPVFLGQILPQGRLRRRALRVGEAIPARSGWTTSSAAAGAYNFTGYCQRLVTRDLDQANRILDERQQARVLNRADRQMAQ